MLQVRPSTAHDDLDSTAVATSFGEGTKAYPAGIPAAISFSRRRKSSWCLSSSSVKRTSDSNTTWSPRACGACSCTSLPPMARSTIANMLA